MSLWKWNEVELEVDMEDVDFQERYENAFYKLEAAEKELKNIGTVSAFTRKYCQMFWDLFDDIFGDNTSHQLFQGKYHSGMCEDCYDSFISFCNEQTKEISAKRAKRIAKYSVKKKK